MAWAVDSSSTDALLTDVRATGFLPDAGDQDSTDLLRFADKELRTMVAAAIIGMRGELWRRYEDQTIVPGTLDYRVPRRVLKIAAVTAIDPSGNVLPPLVEVDAAMLRTQFPATQAVGTPQFYAFEGDMLHLGQVEARSGWTLRIWYYVRPSQLVAVSTSTMARIAAAPTTTSLTLVDTTLAAGLTTARALVDIVRGVEPFQHIAIDRSKDGSNFSGNPYTLDPATPVVVADFTFDGIATGSSSSATIGRELAWLVQRDQTPFPPIPRSLWDALVHGTVAAALEAVRDPGAGQMRSVALAKLREGMTLLSPRDQRNTKRVVSTSPLRSRGGSRWWRPL